MAKLLKVKSGVFFFIEREVVNTEREINSIGLINNLSFVIYLITKHNGANS